MTGRLDRLQRRRPWAGFPIAVIYKFVEDQGVYLAALITYYGFLSLFPLLLLLASVLGFLLQNQPEARDYILDSALSQFPVIGSELDDPSGLQGSGIAVVVGAVVAIYGALRAAQAIHHAMDVCWAVPRHKRPNAVAARMRSVMLVGVGALALLASTVLSALGSSAEAYGVGLGGLTAVLLILLSVLVNASVLVLAMKISTVHPVTWRDVLPGALTAAVGWQLLQSFGTAYVGRVVKNTSDTYGVFALVLGLMAFIFMAACVVVLSVEINVVRAKDLYPRSLLAPFPEDNALTEADEEAYTDAATATRAKESEEVDVSFDQDSQDAAPR